MQNRGLLTGDDRDFFQGRKDVNDPEKVAREKRFNIRRRIEHIAEDIEILREAGEDEVLAKFHEETGRHSHLESEIQALREQLDQDGDSK
jgi:hypothetical protein